MALIDNFLRMNEYRRFRIDDAKEFKAVRIAGKAVEASQLVG